MCEYWIWPKLHIIQHSPARHRLSIPVLSFSLSLTLHKRKRLLIFFYPFGRIRFTRFWVLWARCGVEKKALAAGRVPVKVGWGKHTVGLGEGSGVAFLLATRVQRRLTSLHEAGDHATRSSRLTSTFVPFSNSRIETDFLWTPVISFLLPLSFFPTFSLTTLSTTGCRCRCFFNMWALVRSRALTVHNFRDRQILDGSGKV